MTSVKEHAPWYVTITTALLAFLRELTRSEPECAVRSLEELQAIIELLQGGG